MLESYFRVINQDLISFDVHCRGCYQLFCASFIKFIAKHYYYSESFVHKRYTQQMQFLEFKCIIAYPLKLLQRQDPLKMCQILYKCCFPWGNGIPFCLKLYKQFLKKVIFKRDIFFFIFSTLKQIMKKVLYIFS